MDSNHPAFNQEWLLTGLDMIFDRLGARAREVYFSLDVEKHDHNDDGCYTLRADARVCASDGVIEEEELDEIPAVRRLERMAEALWDAVPVTIDQEGDISHVTSVEAGPGYIKADLSSQTEDSCIKFGSRYDEAHGVWQAYETYQIGNIDVPESDLLAGDPMSLFQQVSDIEYDETAPAPLTVERGENNTLLFTFEPGTMLKHFPSGEQSWT